MHVFLSKVPFITKRIFGKKTGFSPVREGGGPPPPPLASILTNSPLTKIWFLIINVPLDDSGLPSPQSLSSPPTPLFVMSTMVN